SGTDPISFNAGSSSVIVPPGPGTPYSTTIVERGSMGLVDGGAMNWGRWTNAASITDPIIGTYNPQSGVPFVVGNSNVTLPTSGTFLYSFAGGPNPTSATGTVGSF